MRSLATAGSTSAGAEAATAARRGAAGSAAGASPDDVAARSAAAASAITTARRTASTLGSASSVPVVMESDRDRRMDKLHALRGAGIEPYPYRFDRSTTVAELRQR